MNKRPLKNRTLVYRLLLYFAVMFLSYGCNSGDRQQADSLPEFMEFSPIAEFELDSIWNAIDTAKQRMDDSLYVNEEWIYRLHLKAYDAICLMLHMRTCYNGDLQAEFDWIWHSKVMELNPDLDSIYSILNEYAGGNQPEMNFAWEVKSSLAWLQLMGKYKEMISLIDDAEAKKTYLDDYRLWERASEDLIAQNCYGYGYSSWPMDVAGSRICIAETRLEFLQKEIGYLKGDSVFDRYEHPQSFVFDNTDWALEQWYDNRMKARHKIEDKLEMDWYGKVSRNIALKGIQTSHELWKFSN
ncbi:MAG: hypothetical protein J6W75_00280 [Bacteroidaceae bacterium]|nr:hypothetical protein [Bacteroidaceae bacterium]